MKIFINSFPRSGFHALRKTIDLLGFVGNAVEHRKFTDGLPQGTTHSIFIKRDPRNVLASWLLCTNRQLTETNFIALFKELDFAYQQKAGVSLISAIQPYEGWLTDPNTMVIKYEDLIKDGTCIDLISTHLAVKSTQNIFNLLPGNTLTWTGITRADFTSIWTPLVQQEWALLGGNDLLKRWGYL